MGGPPDTYRKHGLGNFWISTGQFALSQREASQKWRFLMVKHGKFQRQIMYSISTVADPMMPWYAMICHAYARGRAPDKALWNRVARARQEGGTAAGAIPACLTPQPGYIGRYNWDILIQLADISLLIQNRELCSLYICTVWISLECMYSWQEFPLVWDPCLAIDQGSVNSLAVLNSKHGRDSAYFPRWRGQHGHRWRPRS